MSVGKTTVLYNKHCSTLLAKKEIHALLMQSYATFNMLVQGPSHRRLERPAVVMVCLLPNLERAYSVEILVTWTVETIHSFYAIIAIEQSESIINIRYVPRKVFKTSVWGLGCQHLPRDLANVNEWKSMFEPSLII